MITKLPNLAFKILEQISINNSLTQDQIQKILDVNPKDVKYAIRRLQENKIVQQVPDLLDMRTVHYRLPDVNELQEMEDNVSPELLPEIMSYMKQDMVLQDTSSKSTVYSQ